MDYYLTDWTNFVRIYLEDGRAENGSMVVLCHYAEGRVLLTDQDGLYNSFIAEAVRATGGNFFLVLTGVPTPITDLADDGAVQDLVNYGGQQSVQDLIAAGRFMTCETTPSAVQIARLKEGLRGALPPLQTPRGVAAFAARAKRSSSSSRMSAERSSSLDRSTSVSGGGFLCLIL